MAHSYYEESALFKRKKINISEIKLKELFDQFSVNFEYSPALQLDKHLEATFWELVLYFIGHPDFTGNLNKGVYVWGGIGRGKTTLMHFFSWMLFRVLGNRFPTHNANDICSLYLESSANNELKTLTNKKILCIDDLGIEPFKVKDFGNDRFPMVNFLESRYSLYQNYRYLTHVTTNLSPEQFGLKYGERLESRFHEMFNIFELKGVDRRKSFMSC